MVLDASLFNTHYYKTRWIGSYQCSSYRKGSLRACLHNCWLTYRFTYSNLARIFSKRSIRPIDVRVISTINLGRSGLNCNVTELEKPISPVSKYRADTVKYYALDIRCICWRRHSRGTMYQSVTIWQDYWQVVNWMFKISTFTHVNLFVFAVYLHVW